ncbi:MAG: amidohydrolase family protein [Holophagales bacterium]|nr:amidohydrolase family protein [Holophagales bacterium]
MRNIPSKLRRCLPAVALVAGAALVSVPTATAQTTTGSTWALTGGTVHTLAEGAEPLEGATVLVRDGLVQAVGADVEIPADAQRFDAAGHHLYPGFFDAVSRLGLSEIGAISATLDLREWGDYNPHLLAATAVHPASELIPVARANGITHALATPGGAGSAGFPGQGSAIHLAGWTVEEMAIEPAAAMTMIWPSRSTREFDFATFSVKEKPWKEVKKEYDEKMAEILDWLEAAKHYAQARAADPAATPVNRPLEALAGILDRGQPVLVFADDDRDIRDAVAFGEEHGLEIVIVGGAEGYKVADLLVEKKVPVILGATQSLPEEEDDPHDSAFTNPGKLHAAGVKIAFGTTGFFGGSVSRTLPYEAGYAVPYGLPREVALAAITRHPAEILGLGDRLGTLEEGKIANLIVADGDPLEIRTQVVEVFIDGRPVGTDNKHRRLYERYRARPLPDGSAPSSVTRRNASRQGADR